MSNFGGTRGAEYEFITQNYATSIQMKLARRACLERNISRCPDFICLDMSSAHRKTRLARLSRGSVRRLPPRPRLAARDTRDMQHKYTIKINRVRDHTLVAHALRQGLDARDPRASRVVERPTASSPQHTTYTVAFFSINIRIIMCGKAGKPSEFRARSRQKAPTPCTNELRQAFTSTARQDGFLERRERERESCLDT